MATTSGNNTGSVQLTTVPTTSSSLSVGETGHTFIRAKTITFTAEGLKPNTRYYPFFNGVFVGDFCSAKNSPTINSGKVVPADQVLTTNSLGVLVGNFYLPANTFVTGSHVFKLVDNIATKSGVNVPDPLYGSAEAIYEANSVLKQQTTQITQDVVSNNKSTAPVVTPVAPTPVGPTPTQPPAVSPPPVTTCESWSCEYQVISEETGQFSVQTDSPTPPSNPEPSGGSTGWTAISVDGGSIQLVSTRESLLSTSSQKLYTHTYSFRYTARKTMSQQWVGPVGSSPPSNPSGPAGAVVTITKPWTSNGTVACPASVGLKTPTRVDPLAQSFFVDAAQYPEGIFVTSIAVYFKTVDQSTPVILELRDMSNGLPGSNVLPGGSVVIPGYAAMSSPDASVATVFRFDSPIYLRPSTDFCFVIKSTSMGYNAWCSRVGEIDVTTGKVIDAQPFSGTLFKSENDFTWIPDSYEDIKFDLYKADFNTAVQGNIVFRPQKNTATNNYFNTAVNLPLSYIKTTKGSNVVEVNLPMHCLTAGDKIFIEGIDTPTPVTGFNGILVENLNGEHTVQVIDEDTITFTTGSNVATKTGNLLVKEARDLINTQPAIMPPSTNVVAAVPFVDPNSLAPSTIPGATYNIQQPTSPTIVSSTSFTVYTNIQANEVMIDYLGTELDPTTITELVSLATGQSTDGNESPYAYKDFIELDRRDFHSFDEPRMLACPRNEVLRSVSLLGNPSCVVNVKLDSRNKDVSPLINTDGMSLTIRSYKIDNQSGEITALQSNASKTLADFNDPAQNSEIVPGAGKAAAKYKGAINVLTQTCNKISLFVTGNCPAPAVIDAYVRTSTDQSTHMDRNWVWVPLNGVFGTQFKASADKFVVNEWYYELDTIDPFTVFDVKLVMRSTNNSVVPKIYGVRAITDNI
jgi:hypothetical protein